MHVQGFPSGSVAKNLPANAGDAGSIPDPGRPTGYSACALQQEKPEQWEARSLKLEQPPLTTTRVKPEQQWRPNTAKSKVKCEDNKLSSINPDRLLTLPAVPTMMHYLTLSLQWLQFFSILLTAPMLFFLPQNQQMIPTCWEN